MDFLLLSGPSPSRRKYDHNGRHRTHRESCSFEYHHLLDFFIGTLFLVPLYPALTLQIPHSSRVASRVYLLLDSLRRDYLSSARGAAPASRYLKRTQPVYSPCTVIPSYESEIYLWFANGVGIKDVTIGQNVSLIHEVRLLYLLFLFYL